MIWAIFIGLVVGAIAKFLMPGRDPGGFIITILLGIGGSIVANWIGTQMGFYAPDQVPGLIASVLGAMLILFLYRTIIKSRKA